MFPESAPDEDSFEPENNGAFEAPQSESSDSNVDDQLPEPAEGAAEASAPPPETSPPPLKVEDKKWYVVKVQSGREETIKEAIERKVKIEGLEESFGQIIIPVERVTEMRNNKRVVKERKLFPGYLMCQVDFNDRILYLFRETSGVGDFVGGGLNKPPLPMQEKEVERLVETHKEIKEGLPAKSKFDKGDRVKVKDGTFAGMDGEVKEVVEAKAALRIELTIFGRPVLVELEYWQVDYA